ncbi:hypothetical protein PAHAL_4G046900 [Panicum hallii]|jgi:hypothetical protein|uniref:Uncharacterized protein n=1 Tax=Panicum hallii TaxID=206008 RepID=A0A2S3HHK1_9POAL|nr:hypothetical protein PAHAL_4G046900 [Panicum hallii]
MEREVAVPNYQGEREQEDEEAAAVVFALERPGRRPGHAHGQLFLDAGRALMLWGWGGALAAVSTAATSRQPDASSSCAVRALLGLVLWLLGVALVALVPVARRFPRAAWVGAAVASAVVGCFFPPRN